MEKSRDYDERNYIKLIRKTSIIILLEKNKNLWSYAKLYKFTTRHNLTNVEKCVLKITTEVVPYSSETA